MRAHSTKHWFAAAVTVALFVVVAGSAAWADPIATRWNGVYQYGDGRSNSFTLDLQVSGSSISGRTSEPATFGDGSSSTLTANISGSVSGSSISFTKTYDGTGGVGHSVEYSATISADGASMSGSWRIGADGGSFSATALDPPVADQTCNTCGRALLGDVAFGLSSSAMLRTYVQQSRAKFENCARRSQDQCRSSCWRTSLADLLPNCDTFDDNGHRACVTQTQDGARETCK